MKRRISGKEGALLESAQDSLSQRELLVSAWRVRFASAPVPPRATDTLVKRARHSECL
ncbi:MAG: hypothetical protein M2R45_04029 [Verrucomicrobia subdivision 3 bacterium]|nr:hypothetical protein [Limisphaerales bacterium]MCS1416987.1 hypothetical protein [Limisphaerales bacterium]